jgi:hypothetical protein
VFGDDDKNLYGAYRENWHADTGNILGICEKYTSNTDTKLAMDEV